MKYRTQSANVLNETDDFERRLDWTLFTQEQNAMLWDESEGWKPGEPLFRHPWMVDRPDYCCEPCEDGAPCGETDWYEGNCVRPMVQLLENNDDTMTSDHPVRCSDCDVCFDYTEDICFICGKDVPAIPAKRDFFSSIIFSSNEMQQLLGFEVTRPIGHIESIELSDDGMVATGQLDMTVPFDLDFSAFREAADRAYQAMRRVEYAALDARVTQALFYGYGAGENLRGMRPQYIFMDEIYPVVPTPVTETVECSDVNFEFNVESLFVQEFPPTTLQFELPHDLDLSGRRPIQPPVLPELDHTQSERVWVDRPITERRRDR